MPYEYEEIADRGLKVNGFSPPPAASELIVRFLECGLALGGLIVFSPIMLACALLIVISSFRSGAGVFFRQQRVGRGGELFTLYKFRTMDASKTGLCITASDDCRITRVGKILRKTKLDELPQLYNILRGEMSFVAPRPEVSQLVDLSNPQWREILRVRPGITDPVTLEFRNEEQLLAGIENRELFYRETIQPYKMAGYLQYLKTKSLKNDFKIILRTFLVVIFPQTAPPVSMQKITAGRKIRQTG